MAALKRGNRADRAGGHRRRTISGNQCRPFVRLWGLRWGRSTKSPSWSGKLLVPRLLQTTPRVFADERYQPTSELLLPLDSWGTSSMAAL